MADLAANVYTDQEPIAQFVALQLQKARQRWQAVDLHLGAKRLIVAGLIIFLLFTIGIWMPTAMFLLVVYGGYRVVRFFYRTFFRTASVAPPMARPVSTAKYVRPAAASEIPAPAFVIKPLVVRMGDLIGSLLAAAAVTGVMCLVMLLIATYRGMPLAVEQAAWLYLVSLVGAWLVLITAKVWEGSRGERMLRHFILMTIGLSLGLAAFGIAEGFLVRLPMDPDFGNVLKGSPLGYASQNGRPIAMAYVAAFATLLGLLRWWMDADPMRASRLSLGSLFVTVVIAHFIALAWQFPEPWLTMVAACMSVTVQLSSPWVPTYARLRPQRKKMV